MPVTNGKYVAPTWQNGGPPALDAAELQAMTNAIEGAASAIGNVTAPAQKMGLTGDLTIGASLGVLADIGNVHVWKRLQNGVIDYLTSVNPDAYQEVNNATPASYKVGSVVNGSFAFGNPYSSGSLYSMQVSSAVVVDSDGSLHLASPVTTEYIYKGGMNNASEIQSLMRGKYVIPGGYSSSSTVSSPLPGGNILYIPSDATITLDTNRMTWAISKYCPVTGIAAVPANTVISYMGLLGAGTRIEVGSYVGTGTYGEGNPCEITFDREPLLFSLFANGTDDREYFNSMLDTINAVFNPREALSTAYKSSHMPSLGSSYSAAGYAKRSEDAKTITWYHGRNASEQNNTTGYIYHYLAVFN